ncbi:regulator of G-protein signaling 22 isoform X2 [Xenopus laevis]|uniref:Regulator of G-protein signaling 22 isoform X2 n=1 Tax=Xenopus laevis TaxID=8355 RepID=A0A8J0VLG0_XENLA|nr:regulator of G-protein signaling 22 isoform X2 [Xenopus laevis]
MKCKRLATVPPDITEDDFEDFLATDDLLVDYFNEFLSLPTFPEAIKFNKTFGIFEVVNNVPEHLKQQMKQALRDLESPNPIYDASRRVTGLKPREPPSADLNIDINYSIMCLNREQGVQWIKKERLPAFLKSDCYFEYRLAKLMSQVRVSNSGVTVLADPKYQPWELRKESAALTKTENTDHTIMQKFFVTLGQASFTQTKEWFTVAKDSVQTTTTSSLNGTADYGHEISSTKLNSQSSKESESSRNQRVLLRPLSETYHNGSEIADDEEDEYAISIVDTPCPTPARIYINQMSDNYEVQNQKTIDSQGLVFANTPVFSTVEDFACSFVQQVMKSAVIELTGQQVKRSNQDLDIHALSTVVISSLQSSNTASVTSKSSETSIEEEIIVSEADSDELDTIDSCCVRDADYQMNSRREFEMFKSFLKGTSGEKLWCLWIDIERLQAIKDHKRQQGHLSKMKKRYLVTNGDLFFTRELLFKLELLNTNHWNKNHLQNVQSEVVKPLLLYWGPRFCMSDSASAHNVHSDLKAWSDRQLRPKRDADPFAKTLTLLPLRPKSCAPRISTSVHRVFEESPPIRSSKRSKTCSPSRQSGSLISAKLKPKQTSRSFPGSAAYNSPSSMKRKHQRTNSYLSTSLGLPRESLHIGSMFDQDLPKDDLSEDGNIISVLRGSKMAEMLNALNLDSRAGYFFATFCEKSGNKLWENGIYFWFDLQSYHHKFYQETLQPFQLCRHSQFLFGTYLAPSASMDIGAEQTIKKEIYQKLDPPFEDLFDSAEEYVLTLLLLAWSQMTESDRQTYSKVELVEEFRQLESALYRKLQVLQQERMAKKSQDQARKSIFLPPPDIAKEPDLWELVPEEYRNYNLTTLIRHRMELEHFRNFLEDHFASMDLMCWIDLEQLRRMPHKEKEKRQEKSKDIKDKYLNKKYFFGPNSPATRDQQEQVMKLAGGWGKILRDRLSSAVLIEVQKYVRMRIEKKWLPMFLATEEYRERQKVHGQMKDVAEDVIFQTNKKKMGVWKHLDSKWISSSKEIIAFRKALMNPVTSSQFQRFISLKGDFLENGLLFWIEVQKYKPCRLTFPRSKQRKS